MIFTSEIQAKNNGWCIELTDMETGISAICDDVDAYMVKIQEMGEYYGTEVEVQWSSEPNLHQMYINEVRMEMAKYQDKVDEE